MLLRRYRQEKETKKEDLQNSDKLEKVEGAVEDFKTKTKEAKVKGSKK